MNDHFAKLEEQAISCGAFKAKVIPMEKVVFNPELRKACEANYCGNFGRNYACPPNVGTSDELIAKAKSYAYGLVFQTVTEIEDSYDFEGMMEASANHTKTADAIEEKVKEYCSHYLQLTAGGCNRCKQCAQITGEPCRMPDRAISSVEAYCMDCSQLATASDMLYINGVNTVTYFGMFLFPVSEVD